MRHRSLQKNIQGKRWLASFLVVLLFPSMLWAQEVLVWKPNHNSQLKIILPILPNETGAQAVDNYFSEMTSDAELNELGLRRPSMRGVFEPLAPPTTSKTRVLIQTNDGLDPGNSLNLVLNNRGEVFVLPPAAAARLESKLRKQFYDKLYDSMDMRINLGGADVHPSHYGEAVTHSVGTNSTRDKFEIELIKAWQRKNLESQKNGSTGKPELGFCRGHQIIAIANGHKMYQDISADGVGNTKDHRGIKGVDSRQRWHHIILRASLLKRLMGGSNEVNVNSIHHQAVRVNLSSRTEVVAVAPDGVVEAMESKDRLTMGVQFHPEMSVEDTHNPEYSKMSHKMIRGAMAWARLNRIRRAPVCMDLFN
jgi:putative glutamine amidotransferase